MKKTLFLFGLMLLLTSSLFAQRAAVMEFKAGVGISQADVDGLSGIFTTYFRPAGYTMVERTQIDRVISEQGFQRSALTEAQMVRIGQILNLSTIIIGDINVVAGEYNVDVRVVNVESGVIIATDGESFKGSYRDSMKKLAERLAGQVAIKPVQTVQAAPKPKLALDPKKTQWSEKAPKEMKWDEAIYYCENLKEGGHSDWKLPNIDELRTLIKNCPSSQTGGACGVNTSSLDWNIIRGGACYGCSESELGIYSIFGDKEGFWSSSTTLGMENRAWLVGFSSGVVIFNIKSNIYYVRCVRNSTN